MQPRNLLANTNINAYEHLQRPLHETRSLGMRSEHMRKACVSYSVLPLLFTYSLTLLSSPRRLKAKDINEAIEKRLD